MISTSLGKDSDKGFSLEGDLRTSAQKQGASLRNSKEFIVTGHDKINDDEDVRAYIS